MPFKGVPIAAAYGDAVNPHQRLTGLPGYGRRNVSHELSWPFQYDLSHGFSNSRVEQSPGGMLLLREDQSGFGGPVKCAN
jgi:hypothetical protein